MHHLDYVLNNLTDIWAAEEAVRVAREVGSPTEVEAAEEALEEAKHQHFLACEAETGGGYDDLSNWSEE